MKEVVRVRYDHYLIPRVEMGQGIHDRSGLVVEGCLGVKNVHPAILKYQSRRVFTIVRHYIYLEVRISLLEERVDDRGDETGLLMRRHDYPEPVVFPDRG